MDKRLIVLTSGDVEKILGKMGFQKSRQKGSHIQFVGFTDGKKRRVTLLTNQQRFAPKTIKSMIEQSGFSKDIWLEYLSNDAKS